MYAIIKTGGKQYRVQKDDVLRVEKLNAEVGDKVVFSEVVAVSDGSLKVGNPFVAGMAVEAEVLSQGKNDKVYIFKYRSKKHSKVKNGHRQPYTEVKILNIGKGTAEKAATKEAPKKAEAKAEESKSESKAAAEVKASLSMKKAELLEIAGSMGLDVDAKATKADIFAAIEAAK